MSTRLAGSLVFVLAAGCSSDSAVTAGNPNGTFESEDVGPCDTAGLTLPPGFCATVYADKLGKARHIAVTPSGDAFVAVAPEMGSPSKGAVIALRDADGDGIAEIEETVLPYGGNGIAWADGSLYLAANDRVMRYALADGALQPEVPQLVVGGLPATGDHTAKTVVPVGDRLYVNFGAASNACQVDNRAVHSPGVDPCPELGQRAGIWQFDAGAADQTQDMGRRIATGMRNTNALAYDARAGQLWGAINGRDQLHEDWPELFDEQTDLLLPSEEVVAVKPGDDYGWPYCYHDKLAGEKVLAPEYGGDGKIVGRCASMTKPAAILPAHWAPLGMAFYTGDMFPLHYRGGMFITTHGSRFDTTARFDPGYNLVFIPFEDGRPIGEYEELARGFAGAGTPLPDAATYRPVGVAMLPDGSLLVGDDKIGRIWRITYSGSGLEPL